MDLRSFEILVAVHQTRSVSAAAARLGLAQPTVSIGLRKLRALTGDPLFVRTANGMAPTPRADDLLGPLSRALSTLDAALRRTRSFDPLAAEQRFRLCLSDSSQMVLLPALLEHLRGAAPRATLEVLPMSAETPRLLEAGDANLAIGNLPQLRAGFHRQRLFEQRFVCLVRSGHPRIRTTLTAEQYRAEAHIGISDTGPGARAGAAAASKGVRVALQMPSFLGVSLLVRSSDLIATVPERLGQALAKMSSAGIRLLACPLPIRPLPVRQHWHARYHRDPSNAWLRQEIARLFIPRVVGDVGR